MNNKALQLVEPLLTSSDSPSGVPAGFITDFVNRYEHDGLADVCNSCVFDYIDFTPCLPTFILLSFPPWSRLSFAILLEARSSFMYFSKSLVAQLRMELASNFWAALFTACRIRGSRITWFLFLKIFFDRRQLLTPVLEELEKGMRQCSILDPFIAHLQVCACMCGHPLAVGVGEGG